MEMGDSTDRVTIIEFLDPGFSLSDCGDCIFGDIQASVSLGAAADTLNASSGQ